MKLTDEDLRTIYAALQTRIGDLQDEMKRFDSLGRKEDANKIYCQIEQARLTQRRVVAMIPETTP